MKWIILLFLMFLLVAIISTRFRRQIKTLIEIWQSLKANHTRKDQKRNNEINDRSADVPLVRCAKCGNWIAQTNALNLNNRTFYCSANCLEKFTVSN
jgi:ribosomal protein L32